MATMRAVDIRGETGPASALFINSDTPMPKPTQNQALVKIKAFGLNRMDLLQREGKYPVPPQAPKTMGVEFSGIIHSFSSASSTLDFRVGDEVFGLAYGGAYAEYIAVSTSMLIHKPKELSWEQAAGVPETWITAIQALYLVGEYQAGQSVLWHAGASGVSIAGIQLSKAAGASAAYITASTQAKIQFCKSIGATEGFNYTEGDWADSLLSYTGGKGIDLIVDFVGADYFKQNLKAAARDAHIVNLGWLSGTVVKGDVDISPFLGKRLRFEGSSLRSRDEEYQKKLRDLLVEHALPKLVDGRFTIFIDKVFEMEEIQKAHEVLESNQTMGKLICRVH